MEVVIVGGGIVGLACAHRLAERDASVTLCEAGSLGGESTQRAAGGIRTQFSTPVNVDLSLLALETWERFEERFGVDIGHRRNGYLFLARDPETADQFHENVAMQNARGGDSVLLAPDEAMEHCPGLQPDDFVVATYSPLDGFADPNLAAQGYAGELPDLGVDVRTHAPVTDVLPADDTDERAGGVEIGGEADGQRIAADVVVNAAGPWAANIAAMAGVDLPVVPRRRQMLVTDPAQPVPEDDPLTIDLDGHSYFRPERDGRALIGGHPPDEPDPAQDPDDYDADIDLDWAADALERAGTWTDYFGPDSRLVRGWAGLYAVTPDHHPIVEETRPGFVTAAGFSGHGFMHAPATARLVAELVLDGEISVVDADPLRSDRFEAGTGTDERNIV